MTGKILSRSAIPFALVVLLGMMLLLGRSLWLELHALSTAGNENAQWTVMQLDTEFANLQTTLVEQASRPEIDETEVIVRTQIALSRVDLAGEGNAADIFAGNPRALELLAELRTFADQAFLLVDGPLYAEDLRQLTELTERARPFARELALLGITEGARRTEARRDVFATRLLNTGIVALAVIAVLGVVLLVLNKLLLIARKRGIALRETTDRLTSTVAASLDAIIVGNEKGEIVDFNIAAEGIFGWTKSEVLGARIEGTILPKDSILPALGPNLATATGKSLAPADGKRTEIMAFRRNGEAFPAELSVTSASSAAGDLVVVYLRDISVRKLYEQALLDAKDNAERTDRAKSQFVTVMSHEMRTPLNGILGVLDLLRTTPLSKTQSRYIDVATGSGEVMLEQVNEALDITRIETGSLVLAPKPFDLVRKLTQITSMLEPLAKEKDLRLTLNIAPDMQGDFVGDENRIGQIITNLIGNAIKFTSEGEIVVDLSGAHSEDAARARIRVADTGRGIPEGQISAVFDDYVALSDAKGRLSRGDGLGLSISRRIARMMAGDITAVSKEGVGSTFTFEVPLTRARVSPGKRDQVGESGPGSPETLGRVLRVLIVEDNPINHTVLIEMLRKLGHEVCGAKNGVEGLSLAMQSTFDVILMDISLPGMDGLGLTREIRNSCGPNRATQIHGLTAYGEEEYLEAALNAGMDSFSTKPIRMHDLARVLRGQPARHGAAESVAQLDVAVFEELRLTLGREKMVETVDAFFAEMSDFLAEAGMVTGAPSADNIASLHRLSGAAALFGLRSLSAGLERARVAASAGSEADFAPAIRKLQRLTDDAIRRSDDLMSAKSG
ncbi:MAG: ATP-binding protein [Pseudomonadota bacterium]